MSKPTVLITGGNRGIGLGFVKAFLDIGYTPIAAVRDPSKMDPISGVIVVKYDAESKTSALEMVEELQSKHGIKQLGIVIANAAVYGSDTKVRTQDPDEVERVWRVNVLSPTLLYQATLPLLVKGSKFVIVGSRAGVLGVPRGGGSPSYGQSKAGVHYLMRLIHYENPDLITFCILPGHLTTDMGNTAARTLGLEHPPRQLSETLPGMMKVITTATREEHSGLLCEWDGTISVF